MPHKNSQNFILLQDFKGGADGRVWLACSTSGRVCVLKFHHLNNTEKLAQEAEIWKIAWNIESVVVKQVGGQQALVMPLVKSCTELDKKDKVIKECAIDAIEKLASIGILHLDLQ